MCDGQAAQSGIGKRLKIDPGNLSRLMGKWAEAGILIRVGTEEFPCIFIRSLGRAQKTTKKARDHGRRD